MKDKIQIIDYLKILNDRSQVTETPDFFEKEKKYFDTQIKGSWVPTIINSHTARKRINAHFNHFIKKMKNTMKETREKNPQLSVPNWGTTRKV